MWYTDQTNWITAKVVRNKCIIDKEPSVIKEKFSAELENNEGCHWIIGLRSIHRPGEL